MDLRFPTCLLSVVFSCCAVMMSDGVFADTYVHGYRRKDGTYVKGHWRSDADGDFSNNWSTQGNINPYTGKHGTRVTPPTRGAGSYYGGQLPSGTDRGAVITNPGYQLQTSPPQLIVVANPYVAPIQQLPEAEPVENELDVQDNEEALQEIESLDYRGISFKTTEQEVLKILPSATLNEKHTGFDIGVRTYEVRDDSAYNCVLLRYFENELVEVDFIYFPPRITGLGGVEELDRRATDRFGSPIRKSRQATLWDFPDLDRIVVTSYEDGNWSQHVYHRSRRLAIPDYRDTTVKAEAPKIRVTEGFAVPYMSEGSESNVPVKIAAMRRRVRKDHPGDYATQNWVIGNQMDALSKLKNLKRPKGMSDRTFAFVKRKAARDHPDDFSTQLYVLENELTAFEKLRSYEAPEGIAGSHFYRMKASAARKHPMDFSTQLYVLDNYIENYLLYRQAGNRGESIIRFLLRFD